MDRSLLEALNAWAAVPGVSHFSWLVDQVWAPVVLVLLLVADVARRKTWLEVPAVAVAVVATDVLCARVLKVAIERPRPCAALEHIVAPFGCGSGFSMPSCHAANAFALAMVINKPWAFVLAVLIALSRSVAGVHYPSDLLVGAVVGLGVGWVLRWLLVSFERGRKMPPR